MAVVIGSARISENGTINGVKGDQNGGKEVSTQNWYLSSKGWYVIRPTDVDVANRIAICMEWICKLNVGYSQADRYDLYNKVKALNYDITKLGNTPCNVDCSEAIRVCLAYAGIMVSSFTTANELNVLNATGKFTILTGATYCRSDMRLKRGDILVTRSKGHTVAVLSNGANSSEYALPQLQKGDKGHYVGIVQKALNDKNIMGGNLVLDKDFGQITLSHLIEFQALNGLQKSGVVDKQTWIKLMS